MRRDERPDRDADLDAEIRAHLDMATADRIARGESPRDAAAGARREFGNVGHVKEVTRETWGTVWFERLIQDLRYAIRSLKRAPAFAAVAVATLALGIGVNTAMFTVINGVLLRPMPFRDPNTLVLLAYSPPRTPFMPIAGMFDRSYVDFRTRDALFEHTATFSAEPKTLTGAGEPVRLLTGVVTPDFFATLGVLPARGRTILPGDDDPARDNIVVLSDELWHSRFNADPRVVGSVATLDGTARTIVGVMPPSFDFPSTAQLWVPTRITIDPRNTRLRPVIGRLKPGLNREQAMQIFASLAGQLSLKTDLKRSDLRAELLPLKTLVVGDVERPLLVLAGAVGLVLLIACTNVANLLLMRATARQHEMALRTALGAGRRRLVRQLLTESMLLGLLGGVCGLFVARWGVNVLVALAPAGKIPRVGEIRLDSGVLALTVVASLITGIAFGLVPALFATKRGLRDALGSAHRATGGGRSHGWLRGSLVVSEISLALVLLVGAGLMIRSFQRMRSVPLGFVPENVLTTNVILNEGKYRTAESMQEFDRSAMGELSRIPGVSAMGMINYRPLGGMLTAGDFHIEHGPELPPNYMADKLVVGGDYFGAMGIRVRRGRAFTERDDDRAPRVLIISQSVAKRFWPGAADDPIGKRIAVTDSPKPEDWMTIVGVVDDVVQTSVKRQPDAALYQPYGQVTQPFFLSEMSVAVRTVSNPDVVAPAMRRALHSVDATLAVPSVTTMDDAVTATTGDSLFQARLLGAFSALALLLAAVGIYGVLAYGVSERSHEIGVRMALGATSANVVGMVARGTLWLVVPGVALGTVAAMGVTRVLARFLFGVTPTDPVTFGAVAALLGAVAIAAGVFPARRASRMDPLVALRHE